MPEKTDRKLNLSDRLLVSALWANLSSFQVILAFLPEFRFFHMIPLALKVSLYLVWFAGSGIFLWMIIKIKKRIKPWLDLNLSMQEIYKQAESRRTEILKFLDNSEAYSRSEFLELPEKVESIQFRSLESEAVTTAQTVRLRWQLERPELLLSERLLDYLVTFARLQFGKDWQRQLPVVKIVRSADKSRKFPYIAVLETDNIPFYQQRLETYLAQVAIPVAFVHRVAKIKSYNYCRQPDGGQGIIGGVLSTEMVPDLRNGKSWPLTCSHVLAPGCLSASLRAHHQFNENMPDAALLVGTTPCFSFTDGFTQLHAATYAMLDDLKKRGTSVNMCEPNRNQRTGYIHFHAIGFPTLDGAYSRFPHVVVKRFFYRQFGFLFPLFNRNFSGPGDSGSWLRVTDSDLWIGMLIGGDEVSRESYVAEGDSLIQYFNALKQQNLIPFINN